MRLLAIDKGRNTIKKHPQHAGCSDVSYISLRRGFLCLAAIMGWAMREVLAWRISDTLEASFCADALKEAIAKYGKPEIVNKDQGSQFTGNAWITTLTDANIKISLPLGDCAQTPRGNRRPGQYLDEISIERLWRSL
ncbi:transposase family protein [Pseudorhodobacter turbinis]|uniref:Transposase family protein n=1 Tax=Pseudorhodobacter turbinis TaxID=2500533 RepID=A0A4P8EHG2_9RHOB|nr:DDE-type integrase/transposase/recombinase [Pseudorhodobacter turbinis]QCO56386.1 transposase family protein [Pseudorhodobacter turbinis]